MNRIRLAAMACLLMLGGCAYMPLGDSQRIYSDAPPAHSAQPQVAKAERAPVYYKVQPGQVDPKTNPYSVLGKTYWPIQSGLGYREEGVASWYGIDFHGKKTATGETYDMFSISAAHKTLPLGTKVRVTNLENGRQIELVVNDRGPFVDGRIIDLSYASARLLGMAENGVARVRVEGIADNPLIAAGGAKALAVASADVPPRKPKAAFVEKDLSDGPSLSKSVKTSPEKAPTLAAKTYSSPAQQADMAGDGRYSVQVGAFSQDENARRVKDKLVQSGFRGAKVVRAERGGRELSVVQAGSFADREQAEEVLRAVREAFPASFISSGA